MNDARKKFLRKFLLWQIIPLSSVAVIVLLTAGQKNAIASIVGGFVGIILSMLMFIIAAGRDDDSPELMLKRLFRGAFIKFFTAVFLFGLAVLLFPKQFLAMLTGFGATLIVYWVALGKNW